MASNLSLISQIAADISANAKKLDDYLTANNLPQPSFDVDAPVDYEALFKGDEAKQAQNALANAGRKLYLLLDASLANVMWCETMPQLCNLGVLRTLCHYKVAENVPFEGSIDFQELSSKTGLNVDFLTRCVRLLETSYYFQEKQPGLVSHTARSKMLATEPSMKASVEFVASEPIQALMQIVEAVKKSPDCTVPPFDLMAGQSFFEFMAKDPDKNANFAKALAGTKDKNVASEIVDAFDWERLAGTIVDIGGSTGSIATTLAKKHASLKITVQDMSGLKDEADSSIASSGLSSQVSFIGHDFFQPQPEETKGAAAYLLSRVLHDWPDEKCQDILKQVVAAMGKDSSIILCESILPEPGQMPELLEAAIRSQDVAMFSLFAARERTLGDFEKLMKSVDSRLKLVKAVGPPVTTKLSIIEFKLQG